MRGLLHALLLAPALALASVGCSRTSTCSRDADSVIVSQSKALVDGNTYHSAPVGGPYQYFPPARTLTFEHGLGAVPYAVQFWLAFSERGTLAPSAGNITELKNLDDTQPAITDQTISVYNDTCSDFYLWVVAMRPSP